MNVRRAGMWSAGVAMLAVLMLMAGCPEETEAPVGTTSGMQGAPPSGVPAGTGDERALQRVGVQSDAVSCEGVPAWADAYPAIAAGQPVTNRGGLYECINGPASAWCRQAVYEPGVDGPYPPPEWSRDAWTFKGTCGEANIPGDRLVVKMPAAPAASGVVARGGRADDKPITGVLRCPLREGKGDIAIAADWGQTVNIERLQPCNYQLILNAAGGMRPTKTPVIITFTEPAGQVVTFEPAFAAPFPIDRLKGLPGIRIEVFATGLIQPRQMAMGNNVLYVGSSAIPQYSGAYGDIASFIYALPLDPATQKPTGELYIIASRELEPHGVAYHKGTLYYSTAGKLWRLDNADTAFRAPKPEFVLNFPSDDDKFPLPVAEKEETEYRRWHQKHPLYFNPVDPNDDALYTAVGIPCNICALPASTDIRYGTILKYDLTTGVSTMLAKGVRNSVGMDWNPKTHQIWFTDNNRQTTGQDPLTAVRYPDELNRLGGKYNDFGVPYFFGKKVPGFTDDEYDRKSDPNAPDGLLPGMIIAADAPGDISPTSREPAAVEMAMGSAPLGVKFLRPGAMPWTGAEANQALLIAAHGASSEPDGSPNLQVASVADSEVTSVWQMITGWGSRGDVSGMPTDILELKDGSLLVSDDRGNMIYHVTYSSAGLPATSLTLHMAPAPATAASDAMPSGALYDTQGVRWPFKLAWNGTTTIKGFPAGKYQLQMDELGLYTPATQKQDINLASTTTVELSYTNRPEIKAPITFKAPAKPEGSGVADNMVVQVLTDGKPSSVAVPWGGEQTVMLGYGEHIAYLPYTPNGIPSPSRLVVRAENDAPQTITAKYVHVESIGKTMMGTKPGESEVSGGCARCHTDGLEGNPATAMSWSHEGRAALVLKIGDMSKNVENGHCDTVCAQAIADYFFDDVWAEYLKPAESFGPRQLRKLSREEYARSVADLTRVSVDVAFLPDDAPDKYFMVPGNALEGIFDDAQTKAYYDEAMRIAKKVNPADIGYKEGGDQIAFVRTFGHRVFRRPLTPAELTRYVALLNVTGDDMQPAPRLVAAMLSSPNFLYRSELGEPAAEKEGAYKLTPDELAAALSYGFLGTTPGEALLTKAEGGGLDTTAQVQAEIKTMIATEAGKDRFLEFIRYYTRTTLPPDPKTGLDAALAKDMWQEQALFVRDQIGLTTSTMRTLFFPGYTFLNQALAAHYGVSGVTGSEFRKVAFTGSAEQDVNRARWGGLLNQGAFLASRASSDATTTSLVRRGFTVRENLLCKRFGSQENDNLPVEQPARPIGNREHWALIHLGTADTPRTCWACHQFVNDTGATMENYDQTAKYRVKESAVNAGYTDQMVDIDARATIVSNGGATPWSSVLDVRGLSKWLPTEPTATRCLADGYFRFLYGTESLPNGTQLVNDASQALLDKAPLQNLLITLGSADAMRYRKDTPADTLQVKPVPVLTGPPSLKPGTIYARWPDARPSSQNPQNTARSVQP